MWIVWYKYLNLDITIRKLKIIIIYFTFGKHWNRNIQHKYSLHISLFYRLQTITLKKISYHISNVELTCFQDSITSSLSLLENTYIYISSKWKMLIK